MNRTVIKIDDQLCNGCGNCVSGCHEGALQLINSKAVMISDLYCDGLGACIGECPVGAISFEEREAEPYDESAVMERLAQKSEAAILAHLRHLKDHGETAWVKEGIAWLQKNNIQIDLSTIIGCNCQSEATQQHYSKPLACGCPGSMAREIQRPAAMANELRPMVAQPSCLRQFPVQLHLLNPQAGFLHGANLLLAADCTAFACGDFHNRFLCGKSLAIACPKLDSNNPLYIEKLTAMIDRAQIDTLTVVVMEVPCCQGLVRIAQAAREQAQRHVPIKVIVLSVAGEVVGDHWI